jgi:dihydroorotate dehydrogenase electron transfer subunit
MAIKSFLCTIKELKSGVNGISVRIQLPQNIKILAGQFFMAFSPRLKPALATPLFLESQAENETWFAPPLPENWKTGLELSIRGPFGNGFRPPETAKKIVLVDFAARQGRLKPLLLALNSKANVVFYTSDRSEKFPNEVEIILEDDLERVFRWADYIAVVSSISRISSIKQLYVHSGCSAQVELLIDTPLICAGSKAACGVCAVKTKSGWKNACTDGPVFNLEMLEIE